jgi:hypothetical protein
MPSDYRISSVTAPPAVAAALLFMGSSKRRTLIVASGVGGVTFVGVGQAPFSDKVFARIPAGDTLVMPFRDFGTLITGEIWVASTVAGQVINGAEVFPVS